MKLRKIYIVKKDFSFETDNFYPKTGYVEVTIKKGTIFSLNDDSVSFHHSDLIGLDGGDWLVRYETNFIRDHKGCFEIIFDIESLVNGEDKINKLNFCFPFGCKTFKDFLWRSFIRESEDDKA